MDVMPLQHHRSYRVATMEHDLAELIDSIKRADARRRSLPPDSPEALEAVRELERLSRQVWEQARVLGGQDATSARDDAS